MGQDGNGNGSRADLGLVLDSLQLGVLLVDGGARITRVNDVTSRLVLSEAADLLGSQPGEALCCVNSYETPEGCGHGTECPTCPIRNSIGTVLERGEALKDIDAPMRLVIDGEEREVFLSVNATPLTMHGEGHVLLTLENETERKKAEAERDRLQAELLDASRRAGMAEVATDVLHNIGNVLNSVNVSTQHLRESVKGSRVSRLGKIVELVRDHDDDLAAFLTQDEKGRLLPKYLGELSDQLLREQESMLADLGVLIENVEQIRGIVSAQESHTGNGGVVMQVSVSGLIQHALKEKAADLTSYNIESVVEGGDRLEIATDRYKVLQILLNLIGNAVDGLAASVKGDRYLTVRLDQPGDDRVLVEVEDNGIGLPREDLSRVFHQGYSASHLGNGAGLHYCAVTAKELGGSLRVHSDGVGQGVTFTLELVGAG